MAKYCSGFWTDDCSGEARFADLNWVPTGSMNPTILEGDLVYVDEVAYDLRLLLSFDLENWLKPRLSRFGEALQ